MAPKSIIWSSTAEFYFRRSLEFYTNRNRSKSYSQKVIAKVNESLSLLIQNPNLGRLDREFKIRVFVLDQFEIYYNPSELNIHILLVWDTRQNPKELREIMLRITEDEA